ncbi:hypothetical protein ABIE41_000395 [Bosea sp. OAE506]|uniref:hypothetical protein n=1 Tax=Bosea sp. OAE506 TaxID=2663870 RepID=UPI00339666C6
MSRCKRRVLAGRGDEVRAQHRDLAREVLRGRRFLEQLLVDDLALLGKPLDTRIGPREPLHQRVDLALDLGVLGFECGERRLIVVEGRAAAVQLFLVAHRQRAIMADLALQPADLALLARADAAQLLDLRGLVLRGLDELRQDLLHRRGARHQQVELDRPVRDLGEFSLEFVGLLADGGHQLADLVRAARLGRRRCDRGERLARFVGGDLGHGEGGGRRGLLRLAPPPDETPQTCTDHRSHPTLPLSTRDTPPLPARRSQCPGRNACGTAAEDGP